MSLRIRLDKLESRPGAGPGRVVCAWEDENGNLRERGEAGRVLFTREERQSGHMEALQRERGISLLIAVVRE